MSVFKGFIKKIVTKEGRTKAGKRWEAYSARIEKEDGTEYDEWVSFGFNKPTAKEGDYVKITTELRDGKYHDVKEVEQLKNAPAPASSGGKRLLDSGSKPSTTQQSIHFQSARKDALVLLGVLLAQDALPLSVAKTGAGKAKRYEEIIALVDKLTVRYYHDSETLRLLETVIDEGADVSDSGKLPEDTDDDVELDKTQETEDDE